MRTVETSDQLLAIIQSIETASDQLFPIRRMSEGDAEKVAAEMPELTLVRQISVDGYDFVWALGTVADSKAIEQIFYPKH